MHFEILKNVVFGTDAAVVRYLEEFFAEFIDKNFLAHLVLFIKRILDGFFLIVLDLGVFRRLSAGRVLVEDVLDLFFPL